jgi:F-type H+-transporting ATPase subunit b
MTSDCRHSQTLPRFVRAVAFVWLLVAGTWIPTSVAAAQQHAAEAPEHAAEPTEGPHEQTLLQTSAKLFNFVIMGAVLAYFLKSPLSVHLAARASHIRQDLVTAAEMRAAASAQLAEIDRRLKTLPAELEALRAQGAQDVVAEQARIAQAAGLERERLIDQTRREIEMRLRVARRDLTAHAAQLAVQVAEARIRASITPEDQLRLVDRYTAQLKEAR